MKSNLATTLQGVLADGGPLYSETNLDRFIAEPWNATSSLAFIVVVILWTIKLRGRFSQFKFISFCLPLLFLGGLGSTLFHAFRNSRYLLLLDVLPISVLTLAVAVYFWMNILTKKWYALFVVIPFVLSRRLSFQYLSSHAAINLSYFVTGLIIFLPTIFILIKTNFKGFIPLLSACLFLIISLLFREIDASFTFLPMGTHWLWHIFSAVGSWFLAEYLYIFKNNNAEKNQKTGSAFLK